MLSSRTPFVTDSAMTLMMHLNDPVPHVHGFRQDVPAELSADLRRALANLEQASARVPEVASDKTIASRLDPALAGGSTRGPQPMASVASGSHERPIPVKSSSTNRTFLLAGLGFFGIACLAIVFVAARYALSGLGSAPPMPTSTLPRPRDTSILTEVPVAIVLATDTLIPISTDTQVPTVTTTYPPLYVRINSITIDTAGHYVVAYETFGYTEQLPSIHVHFFFNTVSVEQAGMPGSGPWYLYRGPSPFTKYRESDRPADATQMCALVANKNHSLIPGSGNCVNLP